MRSSRGKSNNHMECGTSPIRPLFTEALSKWRKTVSKALSLPVHSVLQPGAGIFA
ncbi:hypothetical protein APX70_200003 [Pseudomonas syringae pv. maculicola]|uniref:Uncharacterized protein n=1 Tax=Pseudomonas syringae pv. maculicola TaxID=59511 RepID=A0A3M2ZN13_PSEYM|nr:hypothetical protein APX70_200003 [Pseudomonas syringae pv. maculicola]